MRLATYLWVMWIGAMSLSAQGTRPAISAPATPVAPSAGAPGVYASALPSGATSISQDSYVIGAGDVLQLVVWKEPTVSSNGVPVRPDGRISLPLAGDITAAGKTPMLLAESITERLKKYITDPLVTVTVVAVAPKEIFLIGQVNKTGPVVLAPGMSVLQAISEAGGLSPFAKQKKLYILRKGDKGQQLKLPFDYRKALNTGDMQGISLVPGDTIVVP